MKVNTFLFPLSGLFTNRYRLSKLNHVRVFLSQRKRLKGEINEEFMVYTGVMMFILAVVSFATLSATQGISADNEVADARRVAFLLASEMNLASEIGDGYMHSFELPNLLYGAINYSVAFDEARFISIHWYNKTYSLPVLAQNTSGTVKTGRNIISNVNGVIQFA